MSVFTGGFDVTTFGTVVTATIPSTITGLRFIGLKNRNDPVNTGSMTGTIHDVQFWNGQEELEHKNNW